MAHDLTFKGRSSVCLGIVGVGGKVFQNGFLGKGQWILGFVVYN